MCFRLRPRESVSQVAEYKHPSAGLVFRSVIRCHGNSCCNSPINQPVRDRTLIHDRNRQIATNCFGESLYNRPIGPAMLTVVDFSSR